MNKLLRKVEWNLHRLNLKFTLLDLYLHDGDDCIGFTLCEVNRSFRPYALLSFEFRLPNGAERQVFRVTNWDFLFLSTPIWNWVSNMDEHILWGYKPKMWEGFLFKILSKLYR